MAIRRNSKRYCNGFASWDGPCGGTDCASCYPDGYDVLCDVCGRTMEGDEIDACESLSLEGAFCEDHRPKNRCDDCEQVWPDEEIEPILDLAERVTPGGEVPSGQCPDCGALCYVSPVKAS